MSEFDILLHRPLLDGKQFSSLIPKTTCKSEFIGDGMTDFSIKKMKIVVEDYAWQLEEVADELQTGSLQDNVEAVKWFAYNHFQYKADAEDQMLRTPACSWFTRNVGIDCKSYSIIASCLLLNMGIKHHIRKIKQAGFAPDDWTHVYVIVPVDQQTGSLKKGYYTVDGTLEENDEPKFTESSDIYMNHFMLNGAHGNSNGLNVSFADFDIKNMSDLKSVFNHITCGSSSYDKAGLTKHLEATNTYYNALIAKLNTAVQDDDTNSFASAVCEFKGNSRMFSDATRNRQRGGFNKCTNDLLDVQAKAFNFYRDTVGLALDAWLNQYFVANPTPQTMEFSSVGAEAKYGMRFLNAQPAIKVAQPVIIYTTKTGLSDIKAFVITPYVAEAVGTNTTSFNAPAFLSGLSTVIASFQPSGSGGINTNPNDPNTPINPATGLPWGSVPVRTSEAGSGTMVTALLIAGIGYMAYKFISTPDKPGAAAKSVKV